MLRAFADPETSLKIKAALSMDWMLNFFLRMESPVNKRFEKTIPEAHERIEDLLGDIHRDDPDQDHEN
jgi:hypothetical protein